MAGSIPSNGEVNDSDHTNTNNVTKASNLSMRISLFRQNFIRRAERIHARIPAIRKIPLSAIGIISLIALINMLIWAVCGVVLVRLPSLPSTRLVLTNMCSIFIRKSLLTMLHESKGQV